MLTPERWQHLKPLFHSALAQPPHERATFLNHACGDDAQLRAEIESLIAAHEQTGEFLDAPAYAVTAPLLADDLKELVVGQSLGHYEIVDLLGTGGMGEVYLARDTKLDRAVALKILPAAVASDRQRMGRFMQEAKSISTLNHPNILTIHEINTEHGTPFIATEFVDGETLRARLSRSRHSLREVLDVAIQVASALSAAHKAGIVHRDIKPENIMVRRADGLVKVLDFGLAKFTGLGPADCGLRNEETETLVLSPQSNPQSAGPNPQSTAPGVVMGTVYYMSPEQARALAVDERTDIWSLGVVLYEMLAGRAPFTGETPLDVLVAILGHEPPAFAPREEEIPDELNWIVTKALCKDRAERYQTAAGLLSDLKSLRHRVEVETELKRFVAPERKGEAREAATNNGVPLAATSEVAAAAQTGGMARDIHTTSSAEDIIGAVRKYKFISLGMLAALIVALAVAGYFGYSRFFAARADALNSIAVLPFQNGSNDATLDYLSDGLSMSLIDKLSQLPQLKVIARSSSFKYRGDNIDVQDAANKLGVRVIVLGQVVRRGEQLTVRVEMVDVRENRQLWSEQYNRRAADAQTVQEEIAQTVSEKLRLKLSGAQEQQFAKRSAANPQAYELLLKGHFHRSKTGTENQKKAAEYYRQATAVDPAYAPAYAALSISYSDLAHAGILDPKEFTPKAETAVRRALELDESLAEAHDALALLKLNDWDWATAGQEYRRAIELNPNFAKAHSGYAFYLSLVGRHEQAVAEYRRAREMNPLSPPVNASVGYGLFHARRYDEAIETLKNALELDRDHPLTNGLLAHTYLGKGMYAEAIAAYERVIELGGEPGYRIYLGAAYAQAGERGRARAILKELETSESYVSPGELAILYAALGEREQALASLERAYAARDAQLQFLRVEPGFDPLRSDPRFQDLMRRVGLPP